MSRQEDEEDVPNVSGAEIEISGERVTARYMDDIARFKKMMTRIFPGRQTLEEELADIKKAQAGDTLARDRLAAANAHVVVGVVKWFVSRGAMNFVRSISLWNLLAEGQLGMLDAIARFKLGNGTRLASYASYRVKDYVVEVIRRSHFMSGGVVRAAMSMSRYLEKRRKDVAAELGREPSQAELYKGLSKKEQGKLSEAEIVSQFISNASTVELDEFSEQAVTGDIVGIAATLAGEEQFNRLREFVDSVLAGRERIVVKVRYMDGGDDKVGFAEIAARIGLSESRACQLHGEAIEKLRKHRDRF